jgi:hypothetical protein
VTAPSSADIMVSRLGHKSRRRMCPLYVTGLIGAGDRKSVQPMAERLAPGDCDIADYAVPWISGSQVSEFRFWTRGRVYRMLL